MLGKKRTQPSKDRAGRTGSQAGADEEDRLRLSLQRNNSRKIEIYTKIRDLDGIIGEKPGES